MGVSHALREAREYRGLKQRDLGRQIGLRDSMLSMIENGHRRLPPDVKPVLARKLDHPRFYVELALAATGGAGPMWFDGPNADEHCLCRSEDAVIEMAEAIAVMERARKSLVSGGMTDAEARQYEDDAADAVDRLLNALGRHCLKTGRSYGAVWDRQRVHNEQRGYVRKEANRLVRTA